jgi:hypothetical protein
MEVPGGHPWEATACLLFLPHSQPPNNVVVKSAGGKLYTVYFNSKTYIFTIIKSRK